MVRIGCRNIGWVFFVENGINICWGDEVRMVLRSEVNACSWVLMFLVGTDGVAVGLLVVVLIGESVTGMPASWTSFLRIFTLSWVV